jgi:hypothetical protein
MASASATAPLQPYTLSPASASTGSAPAAARAGVSSLDPIASSSSSSGLISGSSASAAASLLGKRCAPSPPMSGFATAAAAAEAMVASGRVVMGASASGPEVVASRLKLDYRDHVELSFKESFPLVPAVFPGGRAAEVVPVRVVILPDKGSGGTPHEELVQVLQAGGPVVADAVVVSVALAKLYVNPYCDALGLPRVSRAKLVAPSTVLLGGPSMLLEGGSVAITAAQAWLQAVTGADMGCIAGTGRLLLSGEVGGVGGVYACACGRVGRVGAVYAWRRPASQSVGLRLLV